MPEVSEAQQFFDRLLDIGRRIEDVGGQRCHSKLGLGERQIQCQRRPDHSKNHTAAFKNFKLEWWD